MSPSDYAPVEVEKYRLENRAGMVLRACVPSLPTVIFRPEARGRTLSKVTALAGLHLTAIFIWSAR